MLKNDACPEITVKTILAGQLFQAQSVWEMKAFEYIACRAFDSFVDFTQTVVELGTETTYAPDAAQRLGAAITSANATGRRSPCSPRGFRHRRRCGLSPNLAIFALLLFCVCYELFAWHKCRAMRLCLD